MLKRIALVVLAVGLVVAVVASTGQGEPIAGAPISKPQVVKRTILWPKRQRLVVRHFRPWAEPSVPQVFRIIGLESRRWHASAGYISKIIRCESTYQWDEKTGQYWGLAQIGPGEWQDGLRDIRHVRDVRMVDRKRVQRHARLVKKMSDGSKRVRVLKRTRAVKLVVVRKGMIPRQAGRLHGWAHVRVLARVVAGVSSTLHIGQWDCK